MPRLAGLDAAGVLHHVMIYGIDRRHTFEDDADRESFIGHVKCRYLNVFQKIFLQLQMTVQEA